MKPEAKKLVRAILTRVREQGGTASRTKLLKLLYLADLNQYRATGETVTGLDWIFFHYGPWAAAYDELLEELIHENAIDSKPWAGSGIEGEQLSIKDPLELGQIIQAAEAY